MLENDKQDAKKSYKNTKAYHPNIAFIGKLPVHIENHNGNTTEKHKQKKTLERCFNNLNINGIKIEYFRADSASYQKEVVELVAEMAENFYIRNINSAKFTAQSGKVKNWKKVSINNENKEVATIIYTPFDGKLSYRVVVTRFLKKNN